MVYAHAKYVAHLLLILAFTLFLHVYYKASQGTQKTVLQCSLPGLDCELCGKDDNLELLDWSNCTALSIVNNHSWNASQVGHTETEEQQGPVVRLSEDFGGFCPNEVRRMSSKYSHSLRARTVKPHRQAGLQNIRPPLRVAFALAGLVPASAAGRIARLQLERVVLPTNADVFASSWAVHDKYSNWSLQSELIRLLYNYCTRERISTSVTSFEVLQPRRKGHYTWVQDDPDHPILGCRDQPGEKCQMDLDWVRRTFHLMSRSLALVREQEVVQGWRYDLVIRYRFDAVPLRRFEYPIKGIQSRTVYWSHLCCSARITDCLGHCPMEPHCPAQPCWCDVHQPASSRRPFHQPMADIYGFGDSATMEIYGKVYTQIERYARMQASQLPVQDQGFGWKPLPPRVDARELPGEQALLLWSENLLAQHLAYNKVHSVYHPSTSVAIVRGSRHFCLPLLRGEWLGVGCITKQCRHEKRNIKRRARFDQLRNGTNRALLRST